MINYNYPATKWNEFLRKVGWLMFNSKKEME